MRAFCIAAVLLVTLPALAQKRPPARAAAPQRLSASEAEDRQAIEELHQAEIEGNLAFDVDKIASTWDDEIVTMPPHSQPISGAVANHQFLESQRKAMANVDILGYEETWDEVRLLGEYAYEYGSIRSRIRPVNATEETALEFSAMRILKRQPSGAWKVYRSIWNDRRPENPEPPKSEEAPKPKPDVKP